MLLGLVVVLQAAILLRHREPEAPTSGYFDVSHHDSWWDRAKAHFLPASRPRQEPVTPDTVWDDFRQIERMHAQINRMFEDAFHGPDSLPPGPAAASNLAAGGSAPFDPLLHMQRMRRQIDAMFNTARHDPALSRMGFEDGWAELAVTPGLSVQDTGDAYEVTVQLPGFDKSAIRVTLDGSMLDIVAEQQHNAASTDRTDRAWTTHSASRFERRLRLPQAAPRPADVKATYRNGVLRVTVPKAQSGSADASLVPVI